MIYQKLKSMHKGLTRSKEIQAVDISGVIEIYNPSQPKRCSGLKNSQGFKFPHILFFAKVSDLESMYFYSQLS
jgi:hypothetical protein